MHNQEDNSTFWAHKLIRVMRFGTFISERQLRGDRCVVTIVATHFVIQEHSGTRGLPVLTNRPVCPLLLQNTWHMKMPITLPCGVIEDDKMEKLLILIYWHQYLTKHEFHSFQLNPEVVVNNRMPPITPLKPRFTPFLKPRFTPLTVSP